MTPSLSIHPLGIFVIYLGISLSACASPRYIEEQSQTEPDLGISASNDHIKVSLNHVIIPNGPGSWVKDAKFDEYVLTIENISNDPMAIYNIRLVDPRGIYIDQGMNPWQLEKASERLAKVYGEFGIAVAQQLAPAVLMGVGGIGAAAAAAPVMIFAGPAMWVGKMASNYAEVKDKEAIQAEFTKRRIQYLTMSGGGSITGSGFFPLVPSPKALAIDYMTQTQPYPQMGVLEVPLEKLVGLHIEQPKEETGEAEGEEEVEEEEEE